MGDRANVKFIDGNDAPMFFYTHWTGTELPKVVAAALVRGKSRWDDGPYLARIIFSEMIQHDVLDETGYGLSTTLGDGGDRIITIRVHHQTVTDFSGYAYSFTAFSEKHTYRNDVVT